MILKSLNGQFWGEKHLISKRKKEDDNLFSGMILFIQETHEKYFYSTEHWNYFTNDEDLGPVILSLKQVYIQGLPQRMRLQGRLCGIYTFCSLILIYPSN